MWIIHRWILHGRQPKPTPLCTFAAICSFMRDQTAGTVAYTSPSSTPTAITVHLFSVDSTEQTQHPQPTTYTPPSPLHRFLNTAAGVSSCAPDPAAQAFAQRKERHHKHLQRKFRKTAEGGRGGKAISSSNAPSSPSPLLLTCIGTWENASPSPPSPSSASPGTVC